MLVELSEAQLRLAEIKSDASEDEDGEVKVRMTETYSPTDM